MPTATPMPVIERSYINSYTHQLQLNIIPFLHLANRPPISQSDQLSLAELVSKASKSVKKISSSNGQNRAIYELSGIKCVFLNQHVVGYSSNG